MGLRKQQWLFVSIKHRLFTDIVQGVYVKKLLFSFVVLASISVSASEIVCVNRRVQDNHLTVRFKFSEAHDDVFAFLEIPVGEYESRTVWGACVSEEDDQELSLRCDQVILSRMNFYFVRLDGSIATVAKNGKILAKIPCRTKN